MRERRLARRRGELPEAAHPPHGAQLQGRRARPRVAAVELVDPARAAGRHAAERAARDRGGQHRHYRAVAAEHQARRQAEPHGHLPRPRSRSTASRAGGARRPTSSTRCSTRRSSRTSSSSSTSSRPTRRTGRDCLVAAERARHHRGRRRRLRRRQCRGRGRRGGARPRARRSTTKEEDLNIPPIIRQLHPKLSVHRPSPPAGRHPTCRTRRSNCMALSSSWVASRCA